MDSRSSFSTPPHVRLLGWILGLIAVIIVTAIFLGGYGGLSMLTGIVTKAPAQQGSAPTGALLLALTTRLNSTSTAIALVPATLPVANDHASYLAADQLQSGRAMTLQYALSPNSIYATFIGSPYTKDAKTGAGSVSESMNVYRAYLEGVHDGASLLTALQSATISSRPSNADYLRQFPAVSNSGEILFSSLSAKTYSQAGSSLSAVPADSWNILIVTADGTTTAITQGLRPKWIDATHFAFLKNDGIYLYDLTAKTEQKVWASDAMITVVQGFDVSDDGTYVAFSDPASASLVIIHALNWTGDILSVVAQVPVVATNLAFSPDDMYLAAVVLRPGSGSSASKLVPDIEYYSLASQQFLTNAVPIDPSVTSIYISDWR